jgi:predicted DNA-binding transcriptional regulator AlpA
MTETQAILDRLDGLTAAMQCFAKLTGARLTRAEVCERLGIHRNTLRTYITEKAFPTPGRDGKWLLEEVLAWEARK